MLHAVFPQVPAPATEPPTPRLRIYQLVQQMVIATLLLMAIGSATRVMNAGLACPDWPLCYGQLIPAQEMNLQVFLEWFHRLDAALLGILAIVLAASSWWYRRDLPGWVPWLASFALGLIVVQGVLGGLTVTELLRFDIVTAHLGTALLFFVTLLILATLLMPYQPMGTATQLPWIGLIATVLVYLQCLLGGLVASQWAAHQCFAGFQRCAVMNSHLLGVLPPTIATLIGGVAAWRTPALHPTLRRVANLALLFLVLQIGVGVATFRLHLQVEPLTVTHQTIGALLLGSLTVLTVLAWRDTRACMGTVTLATTEPAIPPRRAIEPSLESSPVP